LSIRLLVLAPMLLFPLHAANLMWEKEPPKRIKVRLTAYWVGQDRWTSKYQSSTGSKLIAGYSCAVDPYVIPYGSTVTLVKTGRQFRAVDTGTAVVNRKSEWWKPRKKRLPVVDLFFKSEKEAEREMAKIGKYAEVDISKKEKK